MDRKQERKRKNIENKKKGARKKNLKQTLKK